MPLGVPGLRGRQRVVGGGEVLEAGRVHPLPARPAHAAPLQLAALHVPGPASVVALEYARQELVKVDGIVAWRSVCVCECVSG